jgi:shikimate dehydrogenase
MPRLPFSRWTPSTQSFTVADIEGAVSGVRAMGIQGASITIPHKIAVMRLVDALSPEAEAIGAVNTIINRDGRLFGDNADGKGAVTAIKRHTPLAGRRLAVIGAGGAARAVAVAAAAEGADITVINRSPGRGEDLARTVGGRYRPLNARAVCGVRHSGQHHAGGHGPRGG